MEASSHESKYPTPMPVLAVYEDRIESAGMLANTDDGRVSIRTADRLVSYQTDESQQLIVGTQRVENYITSTIERHTQKPDDIASLTNTITAVQVGTDYTDMFDEASRKRLFDQLWLEAEAQLSNATANSYDAIADLLYAAKKSELSARLDRYLGKLVAEADSLSSLIDDSVVGVYLAENRSEATTAIDDLRDLQDLADGYLEKLAE